MVKNIEKEKTITVSERVVFCDLCEKALKEDDAFVSMNPSMVRGDGSRFTNPTEAMDVCLDCLANNGKAARLLMDTKKTATLKEMKRVPAPYAPGVFTPVRTSGTAFQGYSTTTSSGTTYYQTTDTASSLTNAL